MRMQQYTAHTLRMPASLRPQVYGCARAFLPEKLACLQTQDAGDNEQVYFRELILWHPLDPFPPVGYEGWA